MPSRYPKMNLFSFQTIGRRLGLFLLLIILFQFQAAAYPPASFQPPKEGWKKDSVLRVLAIGNSFSEDALESYLSGLAKAGGYKIIIGNLYIGGASLELHWKNARENAAAYDYRKVGLDGKKKNTPKVSIETALGDEKWDFISFQQASPYSGVYESYAPSLPLLMSYVREHLSNPKAQFILHQTWAYAQNSTHAGFAKYGNNQQTMYKAIMKTSKKVYRKYKFNYIVPVGTAIQSARTSVIGDEMCRDGYHLDLNRGRYTASCTWYEVLFKTSVLGNTFKPDKVSVAEKEIAQSSAHLANEHPYKFYTFVK